jgi:ABC-type multidrug transport system ATPase subunit
MDLQTNGQHNLNLVNLMAYVIQADGKVSREEIDFFSDYIKQSFPKEVSESIFSTFLEAMKKQPVLENILDDVNQTYGEDYRSKIGLLVKIYELMGADGISASELAIFDNVCGFFGVRAEDSDLIKSLLVTAYSYEFADNLNRKITVGDDPQSFDLIYRDCELEVFRIAGLYYFINKTAQGRVFVDDQIVHRGQIVSLEGRKLITAGQREILIGDLDLFFKLKNQRYRKHMYLCYEGEKLVKKIELAEADLHLDVNQNILRLYKNPESTISIKVNGEEVEEFTFVNLSDSVVLENSFQIPLREILSRESWDAFSLKEFAPEKDTLIVSDQTHLADIFIDDGSEKELYVNIGLKKQEERIHFVVSPEKLPYDVYLNDQLIREGEARELTTDSKLVIGKNQILFDTSTGKVTTSIIHFDSFKVEHLTYRFKTGNIGIDDVSFVARSGELIGLMGASGAGKSTLLQLLLGYLRPSGGKVLINGRDFYRHFDWVRNYIGYVPQDDLLLENLTVYENLYYAAKIRMPERSRREINYMIERVLKDIGLFDRKDLKVGSIVQKVLSGGQRKRLNIGIELLVDPDLFFLDEPTSGLSSKDSETIVNLLSDLAKKGKIVFVIIHQPASDIYKKFDKLLLLDVGGKLAYYGDTLRAIGYFKDFFPLRDDFIECPSCGNVNPEVIFDVLEKKELGKDGLPVYEESISYGRGPVKVFRKLLSAPHRTAIPKRRYEPDFWKRLYLSKQVETEVEGEGPAYAFAGGEPQKVEAPTEILPIGGVGELPPLKKVSLWKRARILLSLFKRAFVEKLHDTTNLIMTFLVPTVLGLILSVLLRGSTLPYMYYSNTEITKYFFLSVIIFIFFGLMASVNEVIKDRPILIREKIVDIKPWQYLFSRSLTFSVFAVFQVLIYAGLGFLILKIPASAPAQLSHLPLANFFFYFLLIGFVTTYVSFALGILLSSFLGSQLAAFNIIPLIIIPQIIFGGMFVDFSSMGKLLHRNVPIYSNLTFSRWSYEGLLSASEVFNPVYQSTDSVQIKTLRQRIVDSGKRWDYEELIDAPLKELKAAVKDGIPRRISYEEFTSRIEEKTRDDYPRLYETIQGFYTPDEAQKYYHLREDLSQSELADLVKAFRSVEPNGYYTRYYDYEVNEGVHKTFYDARDLEWLKILKYGLDGKLMSWIRDINIFPAHIKVRGELQVPTVWYNLVILGILIVVFHLLTIWKLRKL